ncbi:MAG TPA: tetratricopeptide repeat protein [Pseudomonadales bacterium]|nr:tetratricopeptide repeat protein [Pseudomonadales bacterium]
MLLAGCASKKVDLPQADAPALAAEVPAPAAAPAEPSRFRPFAKETLYDLLSAELAGKSQQYDLALDGYLQQARQTRDPVIIERALQIAQFLQNDAAMLEAAGLLIEVDPANSEARRMYAIQLIRAERYLEALPQLDTLRATGQEAAYDYLALMAVRQPPERLDGLIVEFDRRLATARDDAQLLFGKAILLNARGQREAALQLAQQLSKMPHDNGKSMVLEAQILFGMGREQQALQRLDEAVARFPDDLRLRVQLIQLLLSRQELARAGSEIDRFSALVDGNDGVLLSTVAAMAARSGLVSRAERLYQQLLDIDHRPDEAHFQLGLLAQQRNDFNQAFYHFSAIGEGPLYLNAVAKRAELLAITGEFEAMQRLLADTREQWSSAAASLYLLEGELLMTHQRPGSAIKLYDRALKALPQDLNLRYGRAMAHEQLGDLVAMERDLRYIIKREPDNAVALNALGYTLAVRTKRLSEAHRLILRAHQLRPQEPAILDSLGWVEHLRGNHAEALQLLEQAAQQLNEPEVIGHLVELLWQEGQQDRARALLRKGMIDHPATPRWGELIKRLKIDLEP